MDSKYIYRPNWKFFLLILLFFGVCAGSFVHLALTNSVGAIINHLIVLSTDQATILYWVFAFFSTGFACSGIAGLYVRFFTEAAFIVITSDFVRIPKLFFKKERTLYYSDITDIKEYSIKGTLLIEIHTGAIKSSISNRMLESNEQYEKMKEQIIESSQRFKR